MKTPRPYQQWAIDYMTEHSIYLCDDCGLGKTLTAVETVKALGAAGHKNLVICPKSVVPQWVETITEQAPGADVIVTNHLRYKFNEIDAWFVTAYDELTPQRLLYPVAQTVWRTIILDEAHRIKNHSTKRSKNIINLTGARKIALSATPVEKHGGELWPVLKWLNPDKFPGYWSWVEKMFETKPGFFGGLEVGDPLDYTEYQAEVSPYIIRREKKDVAPDLPERVDIYVPIEMDDRQRKVYNEVKESIDVIAQVEDQILFIQNALALFTKLHQIASLPTMLNIPVPSAKMDWVRDWLEDNPYKRVLIFSRYRDVVEHVVSTFSEYGTYRVMGGGIDESKPFKEGHGRILAGTIDAMGEGLSFEMADAAIFIDQHWSSRAMKQAADRIHRMNITDRKFIYYLIGSEEDEYVMEVVNGKFDEQEMLLRFVYGN
jgi:SNF2 family DNA or RNA helicase